MKATKVQIDEFLTQPHIALAGYSRKTSGFGHQVYKSLKEKGYNLYPVNPAGGTTPEGEKIYENLSVLPHEVRALYVVTPPTASPAVVAEGLKQGFTHFWVQQMSDNEEVKKMLAHEPNVIMRQCILMHTSPSGIHKFHRWLAGVFGMLPK